jgi:hypothetical protein
VIDAVMVVHYVRVSDPALDFVSGAPEPGENAPTAESTFPAAASCLIFCGIHPKMEVCVDISL